VRKDMLSISLEEKHLEKYRREMRRTNKKKYQRWNLKANWKRYFSEDEHFIKEHLIQGGQEEKNTLNMSIDYFIRNLTRLHSNKKISNRKTSHHLRKLDSRDSRLD
jgi:hypothetical protein